MARLRTQETIISPCVGLAPSINVCTSTRRKKETAPTGSGHTLGPYPGPPRIVKPPSLRCGDERLELLVTFLLLCRTASDPSTTAWLNPLSFGLKIYQPQKISVHLGRNRLPTSEAPHSHRLHGRRFSLGHGQQRRTRSNLCVLPRRLGAMTQGVCCSFVRKLEKDV